MLGHLVAAQFDLEAVLAELSRNGAYAALAQGHAQLHDLARLQRQIGGATPAVLAAMRGEIAAAVAQTHAVIQHARTAATDADAAETVMLTEAAAASRNQAQSLMRDMHRFDPYLRFASPEDEEAYRRREDERRAYIEEQHRRGTPEGDLNASAGAIGQMVDAQAHGAGDSPEFQQRWNALVETTANLREQVQRSGRSTREFDDRLRAELRQTLRARGVPDAEIEARLAAHPDNPLEAVREYMRGDEDLQLVREVTNRAGERDSHIVAAAPPVQNQTMSEAITRLAAAGASGTTDHNGAQQFAHGVTTNERVVPSGPTLPA